MLQVQRGETRGEPKHYIHEFADVNRRTSLSLADRVRAIEVALCTSLSHAAAMIWRMNRVTGGGGRRPGPSRLDQR